MKRKIKWQYPFALGLLLLSTLLYGIHYSIFRDSHNIFFYLLHNIAFIPIQAILVGLVLDKILEKKEKEKVMNKLSMIIGVFFSEVGIEFVKKVSEYDLSLAKYKDDFIIKENYTEKDLRGVKTCLLKYKGNLAMDGKSILCVGNALKNKRDFLIKLIENPVLLEHENFTELLMALFHLVEEMNYRSDLELLTQQDIEHLTNDIKRAYNIIINEWIEYLIYLKNNYPYLYVSAVTINPFLSGFTTAGNKRFM